jgi:N-acetylglucosaminyldiphosphoundecaprenol N-acetyl-beta-D-mannosaminyltransferase
VDENEAVNLLGVLVGTLPVESLMKFSTRTILAGGKARAVYVNISAINLAQEFIWFRDFINSSDISYCDGFGVKWGACLLGLRIPYRFTPPDWIHLLTAECARQGFSIFLLGGHCGVAMKVAEIFKRQFPDLKIAGSHHGYFDKSPGCAENEAVLQEINTTRPDVLLVGMGMPFQERWLLENWDRIETKVAFPVGALFDYVAGELPRAPHWMTDHGLEWLGRLMVEPGRLWRRYLIGNLHFLWLLLKQRLERSGLL